MDVIPFIDVLLVLLILFIIVIPIGIRSPLVPLPDGKGTANILDIKVVRIDRADRLYGNGVERDRQARLNLLATAATVTRQPVIQVNPDALESYEASARAIALIKHSGVRTFAFAGNHQYREFGAD